jgi:hypothetical protein
VNQVGFLNVTAKGAGTNPGTLTESNRLISQASTSIGTFTHRQIKQRRMVRDQLSRADRTVCHFSAAEHGEGFSVARLGGDREICTYRLPICVLEDAAA